MTDPRTLEQLRRLVAPSFAPDGDSGLPTSDCLDETIIAALADGTLEPGLRGPALAHLSSCALCRTAVASVARALADPDIRTAIPGPGGLTGRRVARLAIPLAAAAALLLLIWVPQKVRDSGGPHRGNPSSAAPVAVAPLGVVAEARVLQWEPVLGADRYRITIFDDASRIVFAGEVDDTLLMLPDSTLLSPGRTYVWMVEARTGWYRWTASTPAAFSIAPSGPP